MISFSGESSRLKLLQSREAQLEELFPASRASILTFAGDEARCSWFLEGAIVQGFLQLMETKVTSRVREKDAEIMKQAGEGNPMLKSVAVDLDMTLNEN